MNKIRDGPKHTKEKATTQRWAGHMTRADTDTESSTAMRTRSLQWWKESQKTQVKMGRLHPKQVSCWRCEAQITESRDIKTDGQATEKNRVATHSTGQNIMNKQKQTKEKAAANSRKPHSKCLFAKDHL